MMNKNDGLKIMKSIVNFYLKLNNINWWTLSYDAKYLKPLGLKIPTTFSNLLEENVYIMLQPFMQEKIKKILQEVLQTYNELLHICDLKPIYSLELIQDDYQVPKFKSHLSNKKYLSLSQLGPIFQNISIDSNNDLSIHICYLQAAIEHKKANPKFILKKFPNNQQNFRLIQMDIDRLAMYWYYIANIPVIWERTN